MNYLLKYPFQFLFLFVFTLNSFNHLIFNISLPFYIFVPFILFLFIVKAIFSNKVITSYFLFALLLSYLFFLPSAIFSEYQTVSLFKLFSLFSTLICLYLIYKDCNGDCFDFIIKYLRVLIVISIGIYVFGFGYPVNNTGFSGFLSHPQSFGIFLSIYISLEVFYYKKVTSRFMKTQFFFVAIAVIMLLMTESRTGIFALLLSFPLVLEFNIKRIILSKKYILILISTVILMVAFSDSLISIFDNVVSKSGRSSQNLIESLELSRLALAKASICEYNKSPLWGTGFQISTGTCGLKSMHVEYAFGLPISAPIEKGVFFSAILGESGLLGVIGFIILLGPLVFNCIKNDNYSAIGVLFLCLMTNFGESTLFSLGGIGGFIWASIILVSFYNNDVVDCGG